MNTDPFSIIIALYNKGDDMLTQEILDNIQEIKQELDEKNDAVKATKEVAEKITTQVQTQFQKFGATQSIDERIQVLAESAKDCVSIAEDFHNDLEKQVNDLKLKIETLEILLDRVKKFEEDAGEQNVSIEDEGEKKSSDPKVGESS